MPPHAFAVFALALLIAVATPGPGIIAVVSCALGRGVREAIAMICGLIVGDLVYFSLAVLGLAALAHSMGKMFLVVKLAGAAYLIWLGIKLWRTKPELAATSPVTSAPRGFKGSMLAGLTVTLGNPKVIAFYAGLLPTFIELDKLTAGDAAVMGMILVAVVGGIPFAYALAADRARRFLDSRRRVKLMHQTAGTMMIGAGIVIAAR